MRRVSAQSSRRSEQMWTAGAGRVTTLVAALAVVLLVAASRADANHIPGATYNGMVAGSSMSFTVSGDGSGITSFGFTGPLAGNSCTFSGVTATYVTPLPISNHSFSDTSPPLTFSGSFPTVQGAQGTLRMNQMGCDTGELSWSATTTATPPAPPPAPPSPPPPTSPAPQAPADTTAPALVLSGATTQRVLRQRGVLVRAASPAEASTVTAKGRVTIRGTARVFRLAAVTKQIARGGQTRLVLRLKSSALGAIGRALNADRKVNAKVTVTANDVAGNVTTRRRTIRLTR